MYGDREYIASELVTDISFHLDANFLIKYCKKKKISITQSKTGKILIVRSLSNQYKPHLYF